MMKTMVIGWWCAVLVLMSSCVKEKKWQIDGIWKEGNDRMVYLEKVVGDDRYEVMDSVRVQNGQFAFSGPLTIDRRRVVAGSEKIIVLLEEEPVIVSVVNKTTEDRDGKEITYSDIEATGSIEQQVLQRGASLSLTKSMMQLGGMMAMVRVKDDPVKLDSTMRQLDAVDQELDNRLRNMLDSSRNCYASAFVIGDVILSKYTYEEATRYYGQLTERVKNSLPGKWLAEKLNAAGLVNVGGIAPDIDLPSPDGTSVTLSSLRGKYVLLDFWASWCGPCMAEVPNVKAIYEQYHDRGLEIYGVSLDEKADLWKKTIEKQGMNWYQVSSLKGWKCPVAQRYGVSAIPRMYLLDPQGKIIAMDLRGEELQQKVASLFQ